MRPVLVGEANPYGGNPGYALWPEPAGCSGHRLCHKILQMDQREYLRAFDRVNLCHQDWTLRAARQGADEVFTRFDGPLVLLGARVCQAFRIKYDPFSQVHVYPSNPLGLSSTRPAVILPHPSGLSRAWNDPQSAVRARELIKEVRGAV